MKFVLNRNVVETSLPAGLSTAVYLRRHAGLSGTKIGCKEGDCGACTVLLGELVDGEIEYRAVNSCLLPLGRLRGRHLLTVEGIHAGDLTPVQHALVEHGASQCGFCTPGIVMSATGALTHPTCTRENLLRSVKGNICRCTGYASITRALEALPSFHHGDDTADKAHMDRLIQAGIVPAYLRDIPAMLETISQESGPEKPGLRVAGGTDLMVQVPQRLERGPVELLEPAKANPIRNEDGVIHMDAGTTFAQMAKSHTIRNLLPGVADYMELVASHQLRSVATIGGNIVNASPIADGAAMLLALPTQVMLRSRIGHRTVPLERFFLDYKKLDLGEDEIVSGFAITSGPPSVFGFEKISRRKHLDIASVNSAMALWTEGETIVEGRISAGGVAPVPLFLKDTSKALEGRAVSWETARVVAATARDEASPISDVRGTAQYKRSLLERLVLAHFNKAFGLEGDLP